jgi:hypothetical protein
MPFEIVSPILRGDFGLDQVARLLEALEQLGAVVNQTTGHHVHVGVNTPDFTFRSLQVLAALYLKFEKAFDLMQPRSRQLDLNHNIFSNQRASAEEQGGTPYQAILAVGKTSDLQQLVDVVNPSEFSFTNRRRFPPGTDQYLATLTKQRYYKLNFTNLLIPRSGNQQPLGTVEFRHHSGTVTATKSVAWIRLLLRFVGHCRGRVHMPRPLHADRTPAETLLVLFRECIQHEGLLAYWWHRVEELDATKKPRLVRALTAERSLGYVKLGERLEHEDDNAKIFSPTVLTSSDSFFNENGSAPMASLSTILILSIPGEQDKEKSEASIDEQERLRQRRRRHLPLSPAHLEHKAHDFVPSWERLAAAGGRRHSFSAPLNAAFYERLDECSRLLATSEALHLDQEAAPARRAAALALVSPTGGDAGRAAFAERLANLDRERGGTRARKELELVDS